MEGTRKTVRQKKLDRIAGDVAAFAISELHADEERTLQLLQEAIRILQTASTLLPGYES